MEIDRFLNTMEVGSSIHCLYNPDHLDEVIVKLGSTYAKIVHFMIWPGIALGVGFIGLNLLGYSRGTKMLPLTIQSLIGRDISAMREALKKKKTKKNDVVTNT